MLRAGGRLKRAICATSAAFRQGLKPVVAGYWAELLRDRLAPRGSRLVLNLGCGEHALQDAVNIDARNTKAADVVCDITRLPYRRNSIAAIHAYHVIEHLPRSVAERALQVWLDLLEPGGRVAIECPHFDRAVLDYLSGNEDRLGNIFGLQRFPGDCHLWGWTPRRLGELLGRLGYVDIAEKEPTDYHVLSEPCMRIEAAKPLCGAAT